MVDCPFSLKGKRPQMQGNRMKSVMAGSGMAESSCIGSFKCSFAVLGNRHPSKDLPERL